MSNSWGGGSLDRMFHLKGYVFSDYLLYHSVKDSHLLVKVLILLLDPEV